MYSGSVNELVPISLCVYMLYKNGLKLERNETRDPRPIPISLCIISVLGFVALSLSVSVSLCFSFSHFVFCSYSFALIEKCVFFNGTWLGRGGGGEEGARVHYADASEDRW